MADGFARQRFVRQLDGSLISTNMWFRTDGEWKLVAAGAMHRRPGQARWHSAARTIDMDGIELFESTLVGVGDGKFFVSNVAYLSDGSTIESEEEWVFHGPDRFEYTIYKLADGRRSPWMRGQWVRQGEGDSSQAAP